MTTRAGKTLKEGNFTRVKPFKLSTGQGSGARLGMIDSATVIGEMKRNFEQHLKTLHELKKEQLMREVQRAEGE